MSDEFIKGAAGFAALAGLLLRIFIVFPLWAYIIYSLVAASGVAGLLPLFIAYVVMSFFTSLMIMIGYAAE